MFSLGINLLKNGDARRKTRYEKILPSILDKGEFS